MMISVRLLIICLAFASCHSSGTSKKVVKPRYHNVWAKGNKYRIDIPIGNRHIRLLERKRVKTTRMK
ncbi:MAG: hypothetical protein ORN54_15235 [Cyclobacteriaceae bacterium]|nr:hypothetical protein [Cyclobacteriaceae bacterium]